MNSYDVAYLHIMCLSFQKMYMYTVYEKLLHSITVKVEQATCE